MDLLSKLYKTKCEQLQEQINLLESKVKMLNEFNGPPSYTYTPGNQNAPLQSDQDLEARAREIRKTGMFGAQIPDSQQTQEYRDIMDRLGRRSGGDQGGVVGGSRTSSSAGGEETPDWVYEPLNRPRGGMRPDAGKGPKTAVGSETPDWVYGAARVHGVTPEEMEYQRQRLMGMDYNTFEREKQKQKEYQAKEEERDRVRRAYTDSFNTTPKTAPKPAGVPATKTTAPSVMPYSERAGGADEPGPMPYSERMGEPEEKKPTKTSSKTSPSATSDLVNAGLNAAATKAAEIAGKVSDFMKMNLAQTTPVAMRTKLYGGTEATGAMPSDVEHGQMSITTTPSAAPFTGQTRTEVPTYKIGPTLPTSYVVPESQKWNEMSKDEQVAMAVAALRAGESHKFFGGREKTEGGFLGIGGKGTGRFSEDNAGDTPEEMARLNRQAKMLNKLLDEYDTGAKQDQKKLADELAKQQKAAEQVSQAMKPGSKIKYSDLPFITSNLMKNVPQKKYSKQSEAPKEERASEATKGRAELIPPHYQRVRPNDETHPQEYDVDEQFENALEYQARAMAKAHLDKDPTTSPVQKGEIRWSQETEDYFTDKYKEMLKKYYLENKK